VRTVLRVGLPLLAVLGVLAWGAGILVHRTARAWFERDVSTRARLVLSGSRATLATHLRAGERKRLATALGELAADDRILSAAVCGPDLRTLARTGSAVRGFTCEELVGRLAPGTEDAALDVVEEADGGLIHASVAPIADESGPLGYRGRGPRPQLRRAARGRDASLHHRGLRPRRAPRVDPHRPRPPRLVAELDGGAAAAAPALEPRSPRRAPAQGVPAAPQRRPRPRLRARLRAGGLLRGALVAGAAAPDPHRGAPRRERRHRREPRALHPRPGTGRPASASCARRAGSSARSSP
jgi:hypothetical protein